MNKKIGFVGLGVMGSGFVIRLINQGYNVIVYDVDEKKVEDMVKIGATPEKSPKDVAAATDLVMTSLPNPPAVKAVYTGKDGFIEAVRPGMIFIDLSTVDPDTTKENYRIFKEKGAHVLDAPVSGGHNNIVQGNLPSVMVGGDEEVFEQVKKYLEEFSSNVRYFGKPGSGNVVKLINNMISLTHNAIAAEALVLGTKAGVDPVLLHSTLSRNACRSFHLVYMYPKLFTRNFEADFKVDLGKKDLALALEFAKNLGQPVPLGSMSHQIMTMASALGFGGEDCLAVAKVYEEWAGVEVKGEGEMPEPGLI